MAKQQSKGDRELQAQGEARRLERIRPEPDGISFAAGPIIAGVAKTLFERLAARCAALPDEQVLVAHVHQGEQHRDGVVVTFYPIVTFVERVEPQQTLEVQS